MEDEKKAPLSKAELAAAIKIMENKKRQEALNKASPAALEQKIHFDGWYALRSSAIPKQHMKEVILADFTARGLTKKETIVRYDAALAMYGVKLK